jgi:hypothetical protein
VEREGHGRIALPDHTIGRRGSEGEP